MYFNKIRYNIEITNIQVYLEENLQLTGQVGLDLVDRMYINENQLNISVK